MPDSVTYYIMEVVTSQLDPA